MIRLRKINENDLELIMQWRMKPEVTKYMYTDPVLTIEKQKSWLEKIGQDETCKYRIIQLCDGTPVGVINLANIDYKNKKCSWGYYIGSIEARGKGLARKLECNTLDYIFYKLNLNKLWCEVFSFNTDVIEIHKKFGSEIEGYHKDHILKNGKYYDVVSMGITKLKWENIKEEIQYQKIIIED